MKKYNMISSYSNKASIKNHKSPQIAKTLVRKDTRQSMTSSNNYTTKTKTQKYQAESRGKTFHQIDKPSYKSQQQKQMRRDQQPNNLNTFLRRKIHIGQAPVGQFKKYLDDSENVFYQDSLELKNINRIKTINFYLIKLLYFLVVSYILIGFIEPFPKQKCPRHADCSVYIHCHRGFILEGEKCITDPEIIDQANLISTAVIQQLTYDNGNSQCNQWNGFDVPLPVQKKIRHIFQQFQIQDQMLKQETNNFFLSKQNQLNHQFSYILNTITPLNKKYSLSCSLLLYSQTSSFIYMLLCSVAFIILSVIIIRYFLMASKARKIYEIIENKLKTQDSIDILQEKQKLAKVSQLDQNLWIQVDKYRSKQAKIGYYISEQKLRWRRCN